MTGFFALEPYTARSMSFLSSIEGKDMVKSKGCAEDRGSLVSMSRKPSLIEVETFPVRVILPRSIMEKLLHLTKAFLVFPAVLSLGLLNGLKEGFTSFFSFLRSKKIERSSI
ncbi:MAG: hypothetical protein K2Y01_04985 [Rhabdochlamydiaceae bacterium]|nr:hypothetical protein [Rhabdochlamydiaceae bacterium]